MIELGINGGYFSPIHDWHLILGDWARFRFSLDKVLYIPSGKPPHFKGHELPGDDRFEMVQAAIAGNPYFEASRLEIDRPGITWTIDTLRLLKQQYGPGVRLNFIMGEDNVAALKNYSLRDEFISLARLLVSCRGTADPSRLLSWRADLPGADIELIDCPASFVSSSLIRGLIEQGQPYRYFLPSAVYDIIERRGHYRAAAAVPAPLVSTPPSAGTGTQPPSKVA